jgi:hypothetical protein
MSMPSSVTIQYSNDAGVSKAVKDAANSLRIYDVFHVPLAGDPISKHVIRIKNKVKVTAGVLQLKPTKNFSISFGH